MRALLESNRILLMFSYNPMIISAIKQKLVGYQWHPERKLWSVAYSGSNIGFIKDMGFDITHLESVTRDIEKNTHELKAKLKAKYKHLWDFQVDGAAKAVSNKRLLILDETGCGKCTIEGTEVCINDTLMNIENIYKTYSKDEKKVDTGFWSKPSEDIFIYSLDGTKIVKKKVSGLYKEYIDTTIEKVTLRDGRVLYKTKVHKLLDEKLEWNTKPNKFICVPSILPEGNNEVDKDLIKLLAWQIAEGYEQIDINRTTITQTIREGDEFDILLELKSILEKMGYNSCIRDYDYTSRYLEWISEQYVNTLYYKGYKYGMRSRDKSIPDFILQSNNDNIKIFLQNYFDAEGSVNDAVEISSKSETIIKQLVYMLRKFGIWMTISESWKCATNTEKKIKRKYWRGWMSGDEARKFKDIIGFRYKYKQKILEELCSKDSNTNIDRIYIKDMIDILYENKSLTQRGMGLGHVYFKDKYHSPSRKTTNELLKLLKSRFKSQTTLFGRNKNMDYINIIDKRLKTNIFYSDIISIEDVEYKGWVYDLTVDDTHNYIAEGIVCHNTISALTISDYLQKTDKINRTIYIVKKSNVKQWMKEAKRFYDFKLYHYNSKLTPLFMLKETKHIIMTYDRFKLDYSADITKQKILNNIVDINACIILDEAATIKNTNTIRYRNISHALNTVSYAYGLTGSSMSTHLIKFWVVGNAFCPGWMTKSEFYKYCNYDNYSRFPKLIGYKNLDVFKERLLQIAIRRKKKEVRADMPDKLFEERFIDLSKEQLTKIRGVITNLKQAREEHKGNIVEFELITKVHMIEQGQGKIDELISLIEDELSDNKIVIFSHYLKIAEDITNQLNKIGINTMYPRGDITDAVDEFRTNNKRVMILTDRAMEGTDIPFATCLINFDVRWNTDDMLQREDRIYRINSESNVLIITLVSNGIELYMYRYMMEARERGKEIDIAGMNEQMNTYLYDLR